MFNFGPWPWHSLNSENAFQHCNVFNLFLSLQLVHVKSAAITRKKDSRNAIALDAEQNNIQVKDIVKVIDGPHSVSHLTGS